MMIIFCSNCVQKVSDIIGKFEIKKIKTLYKQHYIKKKIEYEYIKKQINDC